MRVVCLGTGGYHPNERRHTACMMLPELGVALDAGTGVFRIPGRLLSDELDVYLSHAHLDHIWGLTYLLAPLTTGKLKKVRVHGAPKYLDAVRTHLLADLLFPIVPAFEWIPLSEREILADGSVLTHCPLKHPGWSTGYRIDWPGRSLAYITDTTVDGTYTEFIRNANLLLHECNFPDELAEWAVKTGHSNTTPVAQLAKEAAVKRLVMVHIDADRPNDDPIDIARARAIFPDSVVAEDEMELTV
jgi:ribonuclease Z